MDDPRQAPPIVRLVTAAPVNGSDRKFTGTVGARVQSNLGFRTAGKIIERLVGVGEQVKAGQSLMRLDETDLRLALAAKRNAVAAARATVVQTDADEQRYASLVSKGWSSRQRYEQAKAASDTARRNSPSPKPKRGSPRTRPPTRSWWRTRMERWSKHSASRGKLSPLAKPSSSLPSPSPGRPLWRFPRPVEPVIGSAAEARIYGSDGVRYSLPAAVV